MEKNVELSQAEIIREATDLIADHIGQDHDVDYPSRPVSATLCMLDLANSLMASPVGWGPASAITLEIAGAYGVDLPDHLDRPLCGRI